MQPVWLMELSVILSEQDVTLYANIVLTQYRYFKVQVLCKKTTFLWATAPTGFALKFKISISTIKCNNMAIMTIFLLVDCHTHEAYKFMYLNSCFAVWLVVESDAIWDYSNNNLLLGRLLHSKVLPKLHYSHQVSDTIYNSDK